ncbi:MAG: SIS domain-containing protein [Actinomycetota bacterium]
MMETRNVILQYLKSVEQILAGIHSEELERTIDVIYDAWNTDKQIFLVGNGGGAATAMHFACDLNKTAIVPGRKRMRARSLSDNISLLTAWANDTHYTNVFGEQLINFAQPGDLVVGFTASGMSPNIVNAIALANEMGCTTIAFVGFDGGTASAIAHHVLHIPSSSYQHIEDVHLLLCHAITSAVQDRAKHDPNLGPGISGDDINDRLRGIYYVRKALTTEKDLDNRVRMIPQLVARTIGFDAAALYQVHKDGLVSFAMGHEMSSDIASFAIDDDTYESEAARTKRAVLAEQGPGGLSSYAVAPIVVQDETVALIAGGYTNGRRVSGSDLQLLQIFAYNLRGALNEGEAKLPGGGWWATR